MGERWRPSPSFLTKATEGPTTTNTRNCQGNPRLEESSLEEEPKEISLAQTGPKLKGIRKQDLIY